MLCSMKYIKTLTVGHSSSVRTPGDGFPDVLMHGLFMNTAVVEALGIQQGVPWLRLTDEMRSRSPRQL